MSTKTLTTEGFIKRANIIHGYKYDYSLVTYINNRTKIIIICPIHGLFEQLPSNHLSGKSCNDCGKLILKEKLTKWTKKDCLEYAKQYNTIKEWRENHSKTYNKAIEKKWVEECSKHMEMLGNNFKRCIYAYEFEDVKGLNYVYIGLTHNTKNRHNQHKKKGSLFKFCEKYNLEFVTPKKLSDYIDKEQASILEGDILEQYKNNGWIPINKAKPGGLGGGSSQKQREKEFIRKAKLVHNNEYNYDKTYYINNRIDVVIKHNICEYIFKQLPSNHLSGSGCPKCGRIKSDNKRRKKCLIN